MNPLHSRPREVAPFSVNLTNPFSDVALRQMLGVMVSKAWKRPFYQSHWGTKSLSEAVDLVNQGRFTDLPLIRKSHLRSDFDNIVDYTDATDLVSSSGTTGRPVDMPIHFEQEAGRVLRVRRLLRDLGVRRGTKVLQLLSLNDLFTLGVLAWQAIKAEGATAIRCSPSRLDRILDSIRYNKPEFVIGNPFVMVRIAEAAGKRWPAKDKLPNGAFFAVAATFTSELTCTPVAKRAMELWGLETCLNQYGTSELGPVAYERNDHRGLYVHDDFLYVELVDPSTGQTVPDGMPGEVVVTGLTSPRGFLPIRYATGDISAWLRRDNSPTGHSTRIGPIIGRTDHQLKILGQTVFPDLLLNIADQNPQVCRSVVTVKRDPIKGDQVTLLCVAENQEYDSELEAEISTICERNLAVSPKVRIVPRSELEALEHEVLARTNGSKMPRFFEVQE